MSVVMTIARREFLAYFRSPIAYVFLISFLVLANWLFFRGFFLMGEADLRPFFALMPWLYLLFVPAVAMGKWAEERKLGTLELLLTLPIREAEVVIAKFAAGLGLLAVALCLTLPLPFTVAVLGDLDWGPVIGGYLGLLFMGGAYLSIGLLVSSGTENQIIAFIVGVVCSFFFLILGEPMVTASLPQAIASLFQYLGLGTHFASVSRGVIDTRDLVYYCSVIGLLLWWNYRVIAGKR